MKGYEFAKKNGLTNAQVKEMFNLKSHLNEIPETYNEEPEEVEAPAQNENDKAEFKKKVALSIKMLGGKSPLYSFKHLLEG